jgi:molybdate transport system substrate-binding protein
VRAALSCRLVSFFLLLVVLAGCKPPGTPGAPAKEITVAAAANLSDAFAEVAKQFESKTGTHVVLSFGATGDLAKQIENGAPFDVFAAADREHVETLQKKDLLEPDTIGVYARGVLVLWAPPGSKIGLKMLDQTASPEVTRVAVAKPDLAPYGRATVETLKSLHLWEQVEPKVVYGENVSQVKQYAATGNVDLAFIPLALVRPSEGQFVRVLPELHQPIEQAICVPRDSEHKEAARKFVHFVMSPEGQAILKRFGYEPPK